MEPRYQRQYGHCFTQVALNDFDTARIVYLTALFEGQPDNKLPNFDKRFPLYKAQGTYIPLRDKAVVCRGTIAELAKEIRRIKSKPQREEKLEEILANFFQLLGEPQEDEPSMFNDLRGLGRILKANKNMILSMSYSLDSSMEAARNALIKAGFVQFDCVPPNQTFDGILKDILPGEIL